MAKVWMPLVLVVLLLVSACGNPVLTGVDALQASGNGQDSDQISIDALLEKLDDPDLDEEELERVIDELEALGYKCSKKSKDDSESGSGSGSQSKSKLKKIACKLRAAKDDDDSKSKGSGDEDSKGRRR